jgi:tetratricopeptide (TPR) repeat protein
LIVARRHAEALSEAKRARELDPLSPSANLRVGASAEEMGQYDQARVELQRAIEVDLNYWWPHSLLGETYVRQARFDEAIAEFQKARQLDNNPYILGRLGYAYAQSGKRAEALKVLEELKGLSEKRYVSRRTWRASISVLAIATRRWSGCKELLRIVLSHSFS